MNRMADTSELLHTIVEATNILFNLEQESGPGSKLEPRQRDCIKDVRVRLDAQKEVLKSRTSQAEAQAPTTAASVLTLTEAEELLVARAIGESLGQTHFATKRYLPEARAAIRTIARLTSTVGAPAPVTPEICNSQDCGSTGKMDDCPWAKPSVGQFCDHYASYYKKLVGAPAPAPTMPTREQKQNAKLLKMCDELLEGIPTGDETLGEIHAQVTVARALKSAISRESILLKAVMWAFDRCDVDFRMTYLEQQTTASELGKVLSREPSVIDQFAPNEWDGSAKLVSALIAKGDTT